jgi:PAS domain S-box-containing protein
MCVGDGNRFVHVNQALVDLLGYTYEELTSQPFTAFVCSGEQSRKDVAAAVLALDQGTTIRHHETCYKTKSGDRVWLEWSALPQSEDGYIYAAARDVTHRKVIEQQLGSYLKKLRKKAQELERSNRDLEQFAYVASHDLQTPLRKVNNFAVHLQEEFGDRLDDPMAQKYLRFMIEGAGKAQALINGLLQFSRTGRELNATWFDLDEALDEALFILEDDLEEKQAIVKRCALPRVWGDRTLLARVFQNLVGNAIKFRHPGRAPEIKICLDDREDEWQVYISDNGIGFEMQHAEQIFDIFRRLTTTKQGSGLGLALCKRIVDRHGGRIWAESTPEEGTTFHFTLPKEQAAWAR